VIISCRTATPAPDSQIVAEIGTVLERRGALKHPPVTLAVSDSVALGIAGLFANATPSGRVLERLHRSGVIDSADLLDAARTEQGYASLEGHAALHCLIGWMHSRVHRQQTEGPGAARG
jgi:hypothetical protein